MRTRVRAALLLHRPPVQLFAAVLLFPGNELRRSLCWASGRPLGGCGGCAGDKAYGHEEELTGLRDPHVAVHGSFSFMVNFHAVKVYVSHRGGFSLSTPFLDGFKCRCVWCGGGSCGGICVWEWGGGGDGVALGVPGAHVAPLVPGCTWVLGPLSPPRLDVSCGNESVRCA